MAGNVIPIRARAAKSGYAPDVVPFDSSNPAHINAWNTLFALGWAESKFRDKERRERTARVGMEVV
ncbi:hypothetical protein [Novosphingobium sp. Leaf2]|uniref:hypothetical protein n=1 Tax=Novosphingobium sp. Leaf2 TaxID=1735670 RepID=UPI000AEF9321|nr:hypothetical protein [Novosphingobium sp. Leaf2]